jgi:hypothetical protein
VLLSRPLTFDGAVIAFGEPTRERARWRKDGASLIAAPLAGDVVAAHWDWVCGTLTESEAAALRDATQTTLDVVNGARRAERRR